MFDVEEFILSNPKNSEANNDSLELLARETDVKKKVYKFYDLEQKKASSKEEISKSSYIALFELFEGLKDYKYLNSAFKLNDILRNKGFINIEEHSENLESLKVKFGEL